jgi:hypothetical protein
MSDERNDIPKPHQLDYETPPPRRYPSITAICVAYTIPCLVGFVMNLQLLWEMQLGPWIRFRNAFRAEAGPVVNFALAIMFRGKYVNDLTAAMIAFTTANIGLALVVWFSPLRRASLSWHWGIAIFWFFSGCCMGGD